MTDEEIVARAMRATAYQTVVRTGVSGVIHLDEPSDERLWIDVDWATEAVVAALREAGRLVPEGAVVLDRARWERVRAFADAAKKLEEPSERNPATRLADMAEAINALQPGDLEPTP